VFADGSVQAIGTNPNAYVNHSNPLSPLISRADRTVEFWFNTTQTGRTTMFAAGTQNPESAFTISLVEAAGPGGCGSHAGAGMYVQFYNDDIDIPFPNLTDGNWHYVAVTVSSMGTLVNVVIDGQQPPGYLWNNVCYQSTQSPSGFVMPFAVDTTAAPFTFGASGWATGFTGSLDLAAIYPTALAPSVLESHYTAGAGPAVTQVSPSTGPARSMSRSPRPPERAPPAPRISSRTRPLRRSFRSVLRRLSGLARRPSPARAARRSARR
jgi:hypothetical protein